jgi:hypothetical protein
MPSTENKRRKEKREGETSLAQWLRPVILTTWEVEIGRITV